METRYYQTLVMVCETGSFSKAAESLHITQSAVSQRIKFLEEHYGHQLFDRSGVQLEPTGAGLLVLEKSREILAKERELEDRLRSFKGEKRLSICCTPTFGMAYLPRILSNFVLHNADVHDLKFIFKQPAEAIRGVQDKEYDLAVIEYCEDFPQEPFVIYPLPDDELVFISALSLKLPETPLEIGALLDYPIYARRDGCSSRNLLRQNLARLGHDITDFKRVVISDDLHLCIDSVLDGCGVAFVSRSLVRSYLLDGRLRAHYVQGFSHIRSRAAFHLTKRSENTLIDNFIGSLQTLFSDCGCRHTDVLALP
ncbi:multiheme cytochrome-associated LysR family transcriptional regulator [Trichloromonas sp.]|uniref:multiheme cytochrome-associated LysR family transcriptional regulator n=1 Tax=Trichloromonas sp. TaxID=3069249 RepID=UPI002A3AE5A0|nr:LysR family transcriptional regulator [Trichloromonas sp.]